MAGDWIKMRTDLDSDPAVWRMATRLGVSKYAVVGMLHAFWSWADKHTENGNVFVTACNIDDLIGVQNFASALAEGDGKKPWLIIHEDHVEIPNFEKHNGKSSKKRADTAVRVARHRSEKVKRECNKNVTPKTLPEKRREVKDFQSLTSSSPSPKNNSKPPPQQAHSSTHSVGDAALAQKLKTTCPQCQSPTRRLVGQTNIQAQCTNKSCKWVEVIPIGGEDVGGATQHPPPGRASPGSG